MIRREETSEVDWRLWGLQDSRTIVLCLDLSKITVIEDVSFHWEETLMSESINLS